MVFYLIASSIWQFVWDRRVSRFYATIDTAWQDLMQLRRSGINEYSEDFLAAYKRYFACWYVRERAVSGMTMNPVKWVLLCKDRLEPRVEDYERAQREFDEMFPLRAKETPTSHCFECGKQVLITDVWTKKTDLNYAFCEQCFRRVEMVGRAKEGPSCP